MCKKKNVNDSESTTIKMTSPVAQIYLQIRHEFWLAQKLPVQANTQKRSELKIPTTRRQQR